jgi:hypothetical protein
MTREELELKEASGDGAEYFDDRTVFYLQHREQIDTWFGLRWGACQAIARYLEGLADGVASLSETWSYWGGSVGKYQCLVLCPPGVEVTDPPWVALGLGWRPSAVMPEQKSGNAAPFVGIYVDAERAGAELVRNSLDAADGEAKIDYQGSNAWPRYRYIVAYPMWWTDLDSYRQELLSGVSDLVQRYGKALELAVGESRNSATTGP